MGFHGVQAYRLDHNILVITAATLIVCVGRGLFVLTIGNALASSVMGAGHEEVKLETTQQNSRLREPNRGNHDEY